MDDQNQMLIYKAWLETRWRFFAGLILLSAMSIYTVLRANGIIHDRELFRNEHILYAQYIWVILYKGYLQTLWILSAVIIGLGGLWREQALGVAGFTLSLPLARRKLVSPRIALGVIEVVALAFVPSIIIWSLSPITGNSYSLGEAISHALLYVSGGLIFYGLGVLLSQIMQGEFSVPATALGSSLVLYIIFQVLRFEDYNPFDLMSGKHFLDPTTFLLKGQLPWIPMSVLLFLAL